MRGRAARVLEQLEAERDAAAAAYGVAAAGSRWAQRPPRRAGRRALHGHRRPLRAPTRRAARGGRRAGGREARVGVVLLVPARARARRRRPPPPPPPPPRRRRRASARPRSRRPRPPRRVAVAAAAPAAASRRARSSRMRSRGASAPRRGCRELLDVGPVQVDPHVFERSAAAPRVARGGAAAAASTASEPRSRERASRRPGDGLIDNGAWRPARPSACGLQPRARAQASRSRGCTAGSHTGRKLRGPRRDDPAHARFFRRERPGDPPHVLALSGLGRQRGGRTTRPTDGARAARVLAEEAALLRGAASGAPASCTAHTAKYRRRLPARTEDRRAPCARRRLARVGRRRRRRRRAAPPSRARAAAAVAAVAASRGRGALVRAEQRERGCRRSQPASGRGRSSPRSGCRRRRPGSSATAARTRRVGLGGHAEAPLSSTAKRSTLVCELNRATRACAQRRAGSSSKTGRCPRRRRRALRAPEPRDVDERVARAACARMARGARLGPARRRAPRRRYAAARGAGGARAHLRVGGARRARAATGAGAPSAATPSGSGASGRRFAALSNRNISRRQSDLKGTPQCRGGRFRIAMCQANVARDGLISYGSAGSARAGSAIHDEPQGHHVAQPDGAAEPREAAGARPRGVACGHAPPRGRENARGGASRARARDNGKHARARARSCVQAQDSFRALRPGAARGRGACQVRAGGRKLTSFAARAAMRRRPAASPMRGGRRRRGRRRGRVVREMSVCWCGGRDAAAFRAAGAACAAAGARRASAPRARGEQRAPAAAAAARPTARPAARARPAPPRRLARSPPVAAFAGGARGRRRSGDENPRRRACGGGGGASRLLSSEN